MNPYPLTRQQISFYRENGFVQLPYVLTADELEQVRHDLDEVATIALDARHHTSSGDYEKVFVQKVNLWTVHEGLRRYVFNEKLAEIARQLAGARQVRLWHDHALIKMPGDSKPSPWHQDLPYWPMAEPGALSCWMALDDVDERNGCMQFIPESHKWGKFEPIRLVDAQDLFALVSEPDKKDFTPAVMRMRAGSCTFHHGLTFHYASANSTDQPRRAIITIYMPDGTTYTGARHVVTDPLEMEAGKPFDGSMFPVLASES
jgi:phytanoyl-CoA hydroxylase